MSPAPRAPTPFASLRPLAAFTSLSAIDGSIALFAASGGLSTVEGAVIAGLTMVAGVGTWICANSTFDRPVGRPRLVHLLLVALLSTLLVVGAAALGGQLADAVQLTWLPRAAGAATMLLAMEIAGWRPHIGPLHPPSPLAVASLGVLAEVAHHWIQ